jgi:hypothetical protein
MAGDSGDIGSCVNLSYNSSSTSLIIAERSPIGGKFEIFFGGGDFNPFYPKCS